jgi:hypothetical protein
MAYAVAAANRSWAATPDRRAALQKDLGDTDSHRYSQILSGTAVGIQTADNEPVTDVDLTDTFINAAVGTISGQQGVAIQLLDQSPIAFDEIIFQRFNRCSGGETRSRPPWTASRTPPSR